MYVQFTGAGYGEAFDRSGFESGAIAQSGALDALSTLRADRHAPPLRAQRGNLRRRRPGRLLVQGRVRRGSRLQADGRRAPPYRRIPFAGDCFGFDNLPERLFSAEAVSDAVMMRFPRRATERLIDESPKLARDLREMTLRDLANAQIRMLMLEPDERAGTGRDVPARYGRAARCGRMLDLPMARADIADYLGLTIETVCRVLSAFKRDGMIDIPNAHRIELRNRAALAEIGEG